MKQNNYKPQIPEVMQCGERQRNKHESSLSR